MYNNMTYPNDTSLSISPKPNKQISSLLESYFKSIDLVIHLDPAAPSNLWVYDKQSQSIKTNNADQSVSNDFRDWLIQIDSWLRRYGHSLEGIFYYRNNTYFETLIFDSKSDLIKSFVLPQVLSDIESDKERVDSIVRSVESVRRPSITDKWLGRIGSLSQFMIKWTNNLSDQINGLIDFPNPSDGFFDCICDKETESFLIGLAIGFTYRVYKLFI